MYFVFPPGEILGAELPRRRRRLPDLQQLSQRDVPTESPTPAERALAAAIYAPIGLGARLVDELPSAATKVYQRLVFARFIGKMAVDQGIRTVRERVDGVGAPVQSEASVSEAPRAAHDNTAETDDPESAPAPDVDELALPDFDHLPAAHIVGKLGGLTDTELDAVEAYELAHRNRRTVLGKITRVREVPHA